MKRYRKYSIDEVRDMWNNSPMKEIFRKRKDTSYTILVRDRIQIDDNVFVKMDSQRYRLFFTKGTRCADCGIEGQYFWLEQSENQPGSAYHFNLYGIDDDGNEVLMTKDHIVPKAKGGHNRIDNYQTMCVHCNARKGSRFKKMNN